MPTNPARLIAIHGPDAVAQPLLLDSPHSGRHFPADFGAALGEDDLRDGEDCFVDELWLPAVERGVWLLAAGFARTYLDANRHAGDIDLELIEGERWPFAYAPSGRAAVGKALLWRTLEDGRAIYRRELPVAAVRSRIQRCHAPYYRALRERIDATHARFGVSYHIDCHSMNPAAGVQGEGVPGTPRADFVLGDRDGTSCDPAFTAFVRDVLAGMGYDVCVNDPVKGVELVRAHGDPASGRHSLQIEVNKRLYMDGTVGARHAGFGVLQKSLLDLVEAVLDYARTGRTQ